MIEGNIIFICKGNSARSQMAEGFAKAMVPDSIGVFSAGTVPSSKVSPIAVSTMQEMGVDISKQSPSSIKDYQSDFFSLAITLSKSASEEWSFLPGSPAIIHWDIEDPADVAGDASEVKAAYRNTAEKIRSLVSNLFRFGYYEAIASHQHNFISLLNSVSNATLAHDMNRKIFFISEKASELMGVNPAEVIGKDCHDVFSPRLCGESCSFCHPELEPEFENKSYSIIYHTPKGERKDLGGTVIPLQNINGGLHGVVLSIEDNTRLISMEQELGKKNSFRGIVGTDHQMKQIFQQIKDVALYDYPVHIHGETGVGKELIARAIHNESTRRTGPFVPINCGALPEGLVESELFGHTKGSFSGAIRDKKGRIEMAKGGTVFLDEVADLSKTIQVKLLRFLQEGTLEKVGSERVTKVDVRVISATNKDIKQEVKSGEFRDDLFYRLCVIPLDIPPLRKRKNDITLLCEFFLEKIHEMYKDRTYEISSEAMSILLDYEWPGNVRELENVIRFATVKCKEAMITAVDLPLELQMNHNPIQQRGPSKKLSTDTVKSALVQTGGNKAKAARVLGVGRATLYRFLNDHPGLSN